ncbi:zinc transporter 6, chloroplastic isoform X2 [Ziziphus jujuba]|uniref:Zinc transporter 6, chloroplastic isoform X2 n=1 Tax=Ziziphus jujuba TaxID=326968 RepID=A0ABM3IBR7_ZIZJJ|nr:zinc transporter 6, chloroplastic isoform X2 [Ziziphus jujuba]
MASCVTDTARSLACRDGHAASQLKFVSIFVIFFTSIIGIASPVLLARFFQGRPAYEKAILVIKCFAAGVILSTSLVHVLPDAFQALSDCQVATRHPWKDFPFAGLVTLVGALTALLVDVTASSHVESHGHGHGQYKPVGTQEEMVAKKSGPLEIAKLEGGGNHHHHEAAEIASTAEELMKLKQRLVSQVLEIGIIFHSVIIGVTLGMSQNQCTIRPLVAALAFHQIFEGMGLGGCIAQGQCLLSTKFFALHSESYYEFQ